jgi:hypothetical protein
VNPVEALFYSAPVESASEYPMALAKQSPARMSFGPLGLHRATMNPMMQGAYPIKNGGEDAKAACLANGIRH